MSKNKSENLSVTVVLLGCIGVAFAIYVLDDDRSGKSTASAKQAALVSTAIPDPLEFCSYELRKNKGLLSENHNTKFRYYDCNNDGRVDIVEMEAKTPEGGVGILAIVDGEANARTLGETRGKRVTNSPSIVFLEDPYRARESEVGKAAQIQFDLLLTKKLLGGN